MGEGDTNRGLTRARVAGAARVAFVRRADGVSALADLEQRDPLKILFPDPLEEKQPVAVLVNTGGGIVGGDTLDVFAGVGPGAAALVTAQAAEKIYRTWGPPARVTNALSVGEGARLEWLSQETILFDGARLDRRLTADLAADADLLAGEILFFGRRARGETMRAGALAERWSVRRAGVRVWDDALMLDALDDALLDRPALFAGARACATLVCACADPVKARDIARGALQGAANAGAGIVAGLMVTRLLDPDPARLRRDYARVWCALRAGLWDLPGRLPRLWHV
ncbi:MAG: urease accessory protein UreD [Azospirillum sp.]|nr:urease accessory protein UreD [Azospirillum sp.]